ncbi:MAG: HD domain-containing protein [Candidatus Hydrogenedentota bacterium]
MSRFEEKVLHFFEIIHPLDQVKRAGYVLRGVPEPESVAAHSHFVSVLTLLVCDQYPDDFDREKAITLALTHDLCESQLMDIPMPVADAHLREAKDAAEQAITEELFKGFDDKYAAYHQEFLEASSPEARLVRGLDKAQMMIKIVMYQQEGKGRLKEFWLNPKNFNDFGLDQVSRIFDTICEAAGKPRPV